jgi:hypothetical protein
MSNRKPYPGDVSDEEWTCVAPYATLACEDFPKRAQDLRAVTGALRWIAADVFEAMVYDLRFLLRLSSTHTPDPSAVISSIRTLHSSPESGHHAGYDGAKRQKAR